MAGNRSKELVLGITTVSTQRQTQYADNARQLEAKGQEITALVEQIRELKRCSSSGGL